MTVYASLVLMHLCILEMRGLEYDLSFQYIMLTDEDVPLILKVVISCEQKSKWVVAKQDIKALHPHDTWDLVASPSLFSQPFSLYLLQVHHYT